ncbi:nucleotidyltransferase [candidate division WWE3 bacterium CG10_big_fil_rev_8_21_14_0_10_32_10]|uniref:Nucleotidyltransferase n=1 Tax=candidate division WWE3 bacterium CG10_big_fil_rev_8_21_14_0_10_32_10 TaxID=1975090 RepID=A0A2H0RAF4_UNCKA|nr:MAG: nucleotidyltransferase [candidate division WWE3 bacterium CG10_big_fil_rev_8_21_14_0_10_32_10]
MNKRISDFENAVNNLETALSWSLDKFSDAIKESCIKRFELCFDLSWKCIKDYSKIQGLECYSPKTCFKNAFQLKLIDYDETWINELVEARNLSTHVYNQKLATELYNKLPRYLKLYKNLLISLKKGS